MKEISLMEEPVEIKSVDDLHKYSGRKDEHFLFRIIEELQYHKSKNLIIWGTYVNAAKCASYLKDKCQIEVSAIVVNEKYINLPINKVNESNYIFTSIETWLNSNEGVDIIVDFSFYNRDLLNGYTDRINRVFVADIMGAFVFDYPYTINSYMLKQHEKQIRDTVSMLEDEMSKAEYIEFICQKIFGFYNKKHHDKQYFDEDIIRLKDDEVFVDCGAYDGDTIKAFVDTVHSYSKIYAFELDKKNYASLKDNVRGINHCICINKGLGKRAETCNASLGNNSSSHINTDGRDKVEIDTLDNNINSKVSFIKMDIEGYEYEALMGAERLINTYKPRLAICMYHKFEDLWMIPNLIKMMNSKYRLYFRNYHNSASEAVLYALNED